MVSFFAPVRFVGVVGEDCPKDFLKPLADRGNIDLAGLEVRKGSKTFRWHGKYHEDVNQRDTINVEVNVLGEAGPTIPQEFRDSKYVFLANTHPALQAELLDQLEGPSLVVADTMDMWIRDDRGLLMDLLARIDGLVLNDSEALQLTGKSNIVQAGLECMEMVKGFVVVKKGEHGSLLFASGKVYPIPGYPAAKVVDPTGAGDSFAGGMMGYIAETDSTDSETLHKAIVYGTVVASIELEDFSLDRFTEIDRSDIDARFTEFKELTAF